jgi:hypothetical protein
MDSVVIPDPFGGAEPLNISEVVAILPEPEPALQAWQKVWREGIAPLLSTAALVALERALVRDDPRLIQGETCTPPPVQAVQDWPVEAACLVGYCGWQGDGLETVAEVEEYFARVVHSVDLALGGPAACRWFFDWFDSTPRAEMRRALQAEVGRTLAQRRPTRPAA